MLLAKTERNKKQVKPVPSKEKAKGSLAKKKSKAREAAMAKQVGRQASPSEIEDDAEDSEVEDPPRGRLVLEGDPDFEEAFQASRRARQSAREARGPPRGTPQPTPRILDRTLAAPSRPSRASAPPAHLASGRAAASRSNYNPMTGLPLVGPHRRPHALSPYGDNPPRHRGSPVNEFRPAPSSSARVNVTGRPITMRTSNPPGLGFPAAPADRPHPNVYAPAPDGSHRHYADSSGRPAFVRYPRPLPPGSRVGFTTNQRAEAQAQAQAQNIALSHNQAEFTQLVSSSPLPPTPQLLTTVTWIHTHSY